MKQISGLVCSLFLVITVSGCGSNNTQPSKTTPSVSPEERTAISNNYYQSNQPLDNSYLYIPSDLQFCIQLPDYAVLQEPSDTVVSEIADIKNNNLLNANITSKGSLSIGLEDEAYEPLSMEDLQKKYTPIDDTKKHTSYIVNDFNIITDSNNNDIGRKYVLESANGVTIFKQEYKCGDRTMSVVGIPFNNGECYNVIKSYFDSFEKLK